MLAWASDFGLIDLYVQEDGSFYFEQIPAECDLQHCSHNDSEPRQSRGLTGLLRRIQR